ncbi:cAMP-binding domain of CRP or a regulatory subunit of cAMP-dependent protein kinases [Pustulibacterium marinum]|uniref:cAMP-binding domain of CRP or a regulatory subunit of cAMP-dependent protein kinases n=1 Tax=Pustulibacterium marinum TaxID=1224947 RepID=A0A1I7I2X7_9FLAO|nr:Crp/Fnr family transcriptional regulator [Pustulibacterium marinum]SFU67264.1 cAMP-binding domain of CRP or a regulatory subunit of cAMP-dependent protein kinases [Pustulibacterium marinum]
MICEIVQLHNPFEMVTGETRKVLGARLLACLSSIEQACPGLLDQLLRYHYKDVNDTLFTHCTAKNGMYLLLSGMACNLVYCEEHHSITRFFYPGDFICTPHTCPTIPGAEVYTKLITSAHLLYIDADALQQLQTVCPELLLLELDFVKHCHAYRTYERIRFATLPPKAHFAYLCKHQPMLIKHVHKKDIAAYLGVNPSTLSRWQIDT